MIAHGQRFAIPQKYHRDNFQLWESVAIVVTRGALRIVNDENGETRTLRPDGDEGSCALFGPENADPMKHSIFAIEPMTECVFAGTQSERTKPKGRKS